jgi:hypothetical protein
MNTDAYKRIADNVVKDFIRTALQSRYWIYDSSLKIWRTPEEFAQQYEDGKLHLKGEWQQRFRIMHPRKGLAAATIMVNQLIEKRLEFENKILDYYLTR